MAWIQLSFEIHEGDVEALETDLQEWGAASVTLRDAEDQPLFEPPPGELPVWAHVKVTALFDDQQDLEEVRSALEAAHPQTLATWQVETLPDRDWERAWMKDFQAMRFGKRLWIVPSHLTPPDSQAINLVLDPGLAFGTGTHATTALCLEWLDKNPPVGLKVLDFGCGSGVLGLAALKLGCHAMTGVDIDEQALQATRDNLERNQLGVESTTLCYPNELDINAQFDLIIANILAGPLIELAAQLTSRLKADGSLVLSGILEERAADVIAAYEPYAEVVQLKIQDGWARVWLKEALNNS